MFSTATRLSRCSSWCLLGPALALAACAAPTDAEEDAADRPYDDDVAVVQQGLWRDDGDAFWPEHTTIPVCFKPKTTDTDTPISDADYAPKKAAARVALEATFEHIPNVDIDFGGFAECPSTLPSGTYKFLIYWEPDHWGGGTSSVGFLASGTNHTYANGHTALGNSWDTLVTHEAAHVLGFSHEFSRPDGSGQCDTGIPATGDSGTLFTVNDLHSITSKTYCGEWIPGLSDRDKLGLEIAYYDGNHIQRVGGQREILTGGGFLVRADDSIVTDWTRRGAAAGAFTGTPSWHTPSNRTGIGFPASLLRTGVSTLVEGTFVDHFGRSHLATGNVTVNTGLHTAIVSAFL